MLLNILRCTDQSPSTSGNTFSSAKVEKLYKYCSVLQTGYEDNWLRLKHISPKKSYNEMHGDEVMGATTF